MQHDNLRGPDQIQIRLDAHACSRIPSKYEHSHRPRKSRTPTIDMDSDLMVNLDNSCKTFSARFLEQDVDEKSVKSKNWIWDHAPRRQPRRNNKGSSVAMRGEHPRPIPPNAAASATNYVNSHYRGTQEDSTGGGGFFDGLKKAFGGNPVRQTNGRTNGRNSHISC